MLSLNRIESQSALTLKTVVTNMDNIGVQSISEVYFCSRNRYVTTLRTVTSEIETTDPSDECITQKHVLFYLSTRVAFLLQIDTNHIDSNSHQLRQYKFHYNSWSVAHKKISTFDVSTCCRLKPSHSIIYSLPCEHIYIANEL